MRDPDAIDYGHHVTAHELGAPILGAPDDRREDAGRHDAVRNAGSIFGADGDEEALWRGQDPPLPAVRARPLSARSPRRGARGAAARPGREPARITFHYRKGSLAHVSAPGAARRGRRSTARCGACVDRYRFKGAPYPRSLDLIALLREEATTPEQQALITDLFERITLYDLKVDQPTAVRRADGKWDVTVPVEAKKFYADGNGEEEEAPLSERIEIGLFTAEPGGSAFDKQDVILMERRPIRSGRQVLRFVTDRKPPTPASTRTISTSTAIPATTSGGWRAEPTDAVQRGATRTQDAAHAQSQPLRNTANYREVGGEGGIRTLSGPLDSVSYRFHIAADAALARAAVAPCTLHPWDLQNLAGGSAANVTLGAPSVFGRRWTSVPR